MAHLDGRDDTGAGFVLAIVHPFFGSEEEELVPIGIKFMWDIDGSADGVPGFVVAEGRGAGVVASEGTLVAGPGVGVEGGVAEELVDGSVGVAGTAFADEDDLAVLG